MGRKPTGLRDELISACLKGITEHLRGTTARIGQSAPSTIHVQCSGLNFDVVVIQRKAKEVPHDGTGDNT